MNKVELLAPAGDLQRAKLALDFGADAIYLGAKQFSLRARASNFEDNDIKQICEYAHQKKKKVYLVMNIVCHNIHLQNFTKFLRTIMQYKPDGLICSDPYIISIVRKLYTQVEIHVSTQQSVTNSKSALFFARNKANRIIMARETSFNDLRQTIKNVHKKIDIEYFIHGALCIAYSGRCMLSNNFCLRDSNIGGCAQSCRWVYKLFDEQRTYSDKFSMSAKDLCLIKHLNGLTNCGLRSIKIEGRMKSEHYLATVVNAYHKAINCLSNKQNPNIFINDINKAANRETSVGWFKNKPSTKEMLYHEDQKNVNQLYAMQVVKKITPCEYEVISKNYFTLQNRFEVLSQITHSIEKVKLTKIRLAKDHSEIDIVNTPMTKLIINFAKKINLSSGDILRII